jgi:hypothetical protein
MSLYLNDRFAYAAESPRYVATTSASSLDPEAARSWERWFTTDGETRLSASVVQTGSPGREHIFEPDMFGGGRALGTQLAFLEFEGERDAYGASSDGFEFTGFGRVRGLGLSNREVRLNGLAEIVDATPILKSFKGHVVVNSIESRTWSDAPDVYEVTGLLTTPPARRARHHPPSRAYNAFKELGSWLGLSDDELAKIVEVSRTTVATSWKNGNEPRKHAQARRLFQLHSVAKALRQSLGEDLMGWFERGKPCPRKLLEARRYDRFERLADEVIFAEAGTPRPRLDTAWPPSVADTAQTGQSAPLKSATRANSRRLPSDRPRASR